MIYNTFIGLIVGVSATTLGGLISIFFVRDNKRLLSFILALTAGFILSIITFDLIPQAIDLSGINISLIGISAGIVFVIIIDLFFYKNQKGSNNKFLKSGILMGLAIAIHNIPEGLAIGSGFVFDSNIGIKLAIIMALHNLPEGIAMATPLRMGSFSKYKVVFYTFLAGIPTGMGAFLGSILGGISNIFIGLCFAIAAGCMLHITCVQLIPNSKDIHKSSTFIVSLCIGFIIGIILIGAL